MARKIVIRNKRSSPLTDAERLAITQAVEDATRLAIRVNADMIRIWVQKGRMIKRRRRRRNAWKNNPRFTDWLGKCTRPMAQLRRVRRRIKVILRWLMRGRLVFIAHDNKSKRRCRDNPDTMAFVTVARRTIRIVPINALRIKLCPPWFTGNARSRATNLIHELVHHLGFTHGGINNLTEAEALARRGSRRACRRARRSAYNYQGLYNEYW